MCGVQLELCLENPTPQSSPASEAKPVVPPEPKLPAATANSVAGQKRDGSKWRRFPRPDLYFVWWNMNQRCRNPSYPGYDYYGGRGISVCERWQTFKLFVEDMKARPSKKHQLDRINNDGNYCIENCRWVTRFEQMSNTRMNRYIAFGGVTLTASQWSRKMGFKRSAVSHRLNRGWTIEKAITTPTTR